MVKAGMVLGNRYQILGQIGSGGMSDVFKAKDYKLNREVAIKVLKQEFNSDENFIGKFKTEAHAAACLSHPNIVHVFDVGDEADLHYIVMELVEGITLKTYIAKKGKLEIRETIGISMQVAQGIEAAHQQHIVHRDIKPQNIIISRDGKVKVTDFGIAKATTTETVTSNTMGSVHYISPEQARGGYCDERSDIYSLGISMYEMLTGRVPFDGDSAVSVALLHIQGEMIPPSKLDPSVPISLEKIIMKCTQKKPELRYRSITELIADLKHALMNPNEDFVRINSLTSNGPTRVLSAEEMNQIRDGAAKKVMDEEEPVVNKVTVGRKQEPAQKEDLLPEYDDDEYDDEYDEEEVGKADKIFTGIGIFVGIVIVLLALFILGKTFGLFENNGSKEGNKLESVEEGMSIMPNVVGKSLDEAKAYLEANHLGVKLVYADSREYDENFVMAQEYEEGTQVLKGSKIKITVSRGSKVTEVPKELVGKSKEEVTTLIEEAKLKVSYSSCFSEEVKEGLVAKVTPGQGSTVSVGSTVTVYISKGPDNTKVEVPDLLGLSETRAKSRLEAYDLVLGSVTEDYSKDYAEGEVMWQSQTPGQEVEKGTKVNIKVSLGKKPEETTTAAETTAPAPTQPTPTQPAPTQPTDPAPTDPAPTQPTDPAPTDPTDPPTDPAPETPSTDPVVPGGLPDQEIQVNND